MNPTNINIRIEKDVKVAAEKIFDELGLNMTTAVNMFLRQTIRENGIPFELKVYAPNRTTLAAIAEGRRIAYEDGSLAYCDMNNLKAELDG
jgi:DNA-damage-inducible protein J